MRKDGGGAVVRMWEMMEREVSVCVCRDVGRDYR